MDHRQTFVLYLRWLGSLCIMILVHVPGMSGHGRLVEPPSRSSMFRYGYQTPTNYADNQLFCGGFQVQWGQNEGRCGVCGDPWQGPRENEAGGKYAKGIIVRRYKPNSVILVRVEITANHKGWFEFRLCPNNNPKRPVTHDCLDRYILKLENGGTRHCLTDYNPGVVSLGLRLPPGLTCSQCVLQWKYNAGNSWGVDESGKECVGCGPQEQFYGCADIAIGERWESTPALKSLNKGNSRGMDESGKGCVGCGPQEQFYGCGDIAIGERSEDLTYDSSYYELSHHSGMAKCHMVSILLTASSFTATLSYTLGT